MARGISLELRCGRCHSNPTFPTDRRDSGSILGELYVSPRRQWMAWSGPYQQVTDRERNLLPGPRQLGTAGPGTTWRAVPRDGVEHRCPTGGHRIALTEAELWRLVEMLPYGAKDLFLEADRTEAEGRSAPG